MTITTTLNRKRGLTMELSGPELVRSNDGLGINFWRSNEAGN